MILIIHPDMVLWLLLIFAVMGLFLKKINFAFGTLSVVLLYAYFIDRITTQALIATLGFLCLSASISFCPVVQRKQPVFYLVWLMIFIWCGMLMMHHVPGIHNLLVLDGVFASENSIPFTMYFNLDKPLVFFSLFLAYPALLGQGKTRSWMWAWLAFVITLNLLPIAVYTGALKVELSLPVWWWLFAINNLFFTCVTEEALFRGVIQQGLTSRFNVWVGLLVASVLFGVFHFAGGWLLVLFATLTGVGFGVIFYFTQRLWCAVLAHFIFNFVHLAFFTYPLLAK